MVQWSSQNEIVKDYGVFQRLIYALFGLYVWELFLTCDFEWSLIMRRRKFKWPLVSLLFYFFCRYCMLFAFIGLIISFTVETRINCEALYTFNSWTGNMAILTASTCLMIRTIALWNRKLTVCIPLLVLCLAHWVLLYRGMFLIQSTWDEAIHTCSVRSTNASLLRVNFFFTMGFDLVILVCTFVALMKHSERTGLVKLLFQDGLVYFLLSFSMNLIPAVMNILHLNPVMNIIATVPAAALSSIAACRSVTRLQEFKKPDVYVHSTASIAIPGASNGPRVNSFCHPKPPQKALTRARVHVTTDQFTVAEFPPTPSPFGNIEDSLHRSQHNIIEEKEIEAKYHTRDDSSEDLGCAV